jgi:predicted O-linked N-acetylglucosamine transferase (SPINDLY family)
MFFCYGRPTASPDVGPLPAASSGQITFASLNNMCKLTDQAFELWAKILARVPDSRLVVLGYSGGVLERRVRGIVEQCGVAGERVVVVDKRPRYEYFQLHHHLDIALDTFPFSGHTTICDALWMGVPSLVMEGDRYAARFGASTLAGVGLLDWIARGVCRKGRAPGGRRGWTG